MKRPIILAALFAGSVIGDSASVAGNFPMTDLAAYYLQVQFGSAEEIALYGAERPNLALYTRQPNSRVVGGGYDPGPNAIGLYPVIGRLVNFSYVSYNDVTKGYVMQTYRDGGCSKAGAIVIPRTPLIGATSTFLRSYNSRSAHTEPAGYNDCSDFSAPSPILFTSNDAVSFGAPVRRRAVDGGQYDASPMALQRNGFAWETYYWGYAMGMVASESNWADSISPGAAALRANFSVPSSLNNFDLTSLPPPRIEDNVVEYVNRNDFPKQPGGQFFYAVLASDKTLLDSVPNWSRTGKSFKSGGYVSVCRFYGGKNGGPNTHFYSADGKECAALKAVPALSYEGQTFAVNMPMPGSNADGTKPCPIESKPLYRLYNNASAPGKDYVSNHRYVTERTDVAAAVAQGWVDEGQVMCVPL